MKKYVVKSLPVVGKTYRVPSTRNWFMIVQCDTSVSEKYMLLQGWGGSFEGGEYTFATIEECVLHHKNICEEFVEEKVCLEHGDIIKDVDGETTFYGVVNRVAGNWYLSVITIGDKHKSTYCYNLLSQNKHITIEEVNSHMNMQFELEQK